MNRGLICGSRCATDSFYLGAAVSAPATGGRGAITGKVTVQIHTYESVSSPALRRLMGAPREGVRTKDITAVFLLLQPPPTAAASSVVFSFISLHKPSSSLQRAQHKHTQRKRLVSARLHEQLRFRSRRLGSARPFTSIIHHQARRGLKSDVTPKLGDQKGRTRWNLWRSHT